MIACKDCEFNINGLCQRFPPAFAVTPIGRKWAFPMVGAFEGFQGCGEGRMADVVEIPSKFLGSERPSTMEAAVEKTREIGAALAANTVKPTTVEAAIEKPGVVIPARRSTAKLLSPEDHEKLLEVKRKRSRRKK